MLDGSRVSPLGFVFVAMINGGDSLCKGDSEDGDREGAESQGFRGVCRAREEREGKTLSRERSGEQGKKMKYRVHIDMDLIFIFYFFGRHIFERHLRFCAPFGQPAPTRPLNV